MTAHLDIVLSPRNDGSPDHTFTEVENDSGKSVALGTWVAQADGTPAIRFTAADVVALFGAVPMLRAVLAGLTPEQRARIAFQERAMELSPRDLTVKDCGEAAADALETTP